MTDIVQKILDADQQFFIGRITRIEVEIAYNLVNSQMMEIPQNVKELENHSGIYITSKESIETYVYNLLKAYSNCTYMIDRNDSFNSRSQGNSNVAELSVRMIATPHIPKITKEQFEPYLPWCIKGKKILVIHPFIQTFKDQLSRMNLIFPSNTWFKDCTFEFLVPPVTLAGNHCNKDWQTHYHDFLKTLNNHKDFDIALVAAGGYSMLIANHIYKVMGKSVMHVGAPLQLYFGVGGRRWFNDRHVMQMVTEHWTRPQKEDRPANFMRVDDGCYY
jgi:hypothetical protein